MKGKEKTLRCSQNFPHSSRKNKESKQVPRKSISISQKKNLEKEEEKFCIKSSWHNLIYFFFSISCIFFPFKKLTSTAACRFVGHEKMVFTERRNDIAAGRYFQYMLWLGANKTHKRKRPATSEWVTH